MKTIKVLSDVITSKGVFPAGAEVALEDAEADSCIKHGLAELATNPVRTTDDFKSKATAPTHGKA
jgi:hypothetical protein